MTFDPFNDFETRGYLRNIAQEHLASHVIGTQGLGGSPDTALNANEVLGNFSEPALQARYQHQQERRQRQEGPDPDRGPENDRRRSRKDGRGR